ncbi:hypothetical protein ACMFMG_005008 [Clarireedia jacksonii]
MSPPPTVLRSKPKSHVRISFTDWVLGGSLLSTYSAPATPSQQRDASRVRVTAGKDRKGRSVVVVGDKRLVGDEGLCGDWKGDGNGNRVEVMVVRRGRKKAVESVGSGGEGGKKGEEKKDEKVEGEEKKDEGKGGEEKKEEEKKDEEKKDEKKDEEKKNEKKNEKKDENKDEEKKEEGKEEEKVEEKAPEAEAASAPAKEKPAEEEQEKKKEDEPAPAPEAAASTEPAKEEDKVNESGWTEAKDDTLRKMKKENKTWKEIVAELGMSKKNIVARWKELQTFGKDKDKVVGGEGEGNSNSKGVSEEEKEGDGEKEKEKEGSGNGDRKDAEVMMSGGDGNGDDKDKEQSQSNEDDDTPTQPLRNSPKLRTCPHSCCTLSPPTSPTSSLSSSKPKKQTHISFSHSDNQIQDQNKPHNPRRLQPDHIWSKEDCDTLQYLLDRHSNTQWLQLQAGFYNVTGRMVNAEFIEGKFRRDGCV